MADSSTETVNGKSIWVERAGDGDPILMIHGLGGTGNSFWPQVGPLSRTHTVVRPDLEGSGQTPLTGPISIDSLVTDMIALMDHLSLDKAKLIGHSMGTIVCAHMAVKHSERVTSLALLGPLAEPPEPARGALRDRARAARESGMVGIADTLLQVSISAATRAANPAVAGMVREILMRQPPEGYAATCEALAGAKSADLGAIRCPTLLITGDEDAVAPPPAVARMKAAIGDSLMLVVPACGHWTPVERVDAVNRALLNFYFS